MKTKGIVIIGVIVLVAILGIYFVSAYNNFVGLDQDTEAKWSEVENQYQRQADLIPNLVSVVASAVSTETKFVKDVIDARTSWDNAQTLAAKEQAGVEMSDSVATFVNAVAENYPAFKANTQYIALTDEMSGTQNRITTARGRYIESIQKYNTATKKFPSSMVAGMFGFSEKEYYQADEGSLETPSLGSGQLPK
ncbi:MAG: LemA family protein [Candidatus Pacearchaeota archaeon]